MQQSELLTPAEAARLKGVSPAAIYLAISEGRLSGQRVLKRLALKKSDVLAWQPTPNKGRLKGSSVTEETRRKMSEAQKKRWARSGVSDSAR